MDKHYAERDPEALDEAGGYYGRHVAAMTAEGLHAKARIAAELAHRDCMIADCIRLAAEMVRERNAARDELAAERERSARLLRVEKEARLMVANLSEEVMEMFSDMTAALADAAADLREAM